MVYNEREETGKESLSNEAFVPDEFTLNRRNLLTMFNMRETRQEKRPLSPGISPQIYINIARSLHLVPDPGSIRRQAPGYWSYCCYCYYTATETLSTFATFNQGQSF